MEGIRRTSTVRQLEMLVEFAEGNRDLALGRLRSKEARALSKRLWQECTEALNSEGPARNPKEWAKVWNDMKSRVRSKLAALSHSHQGTGGGPKLSVTLSPLEERHADIIGRDVGPLANVAQDPFEAASEENNAVVAEVQIENIARHVSNEVFEDVSQGPSFILGPYMSPPQLESQSSPPPAQPTDSLPPPASPRSAPIQPSQASTPRRGRRHQPRRSRRSAPNTPRTSRVQTQGQSSRMALDESRAMVMRIEELRARTDHMLAQSALRQAEAAKAQAEAAKVQAEAATIAANAERLKAETMAAFYTSFSSLVPSVALILRSGTKRTRRISEEEDEEI